MNEKERYYPYSKYLKDRYGEKVYKLPVNLPISCPNRITGTGCSFCAESGTGFEAMNAAFSVTEQLMHTREYIEKRYHAHKFIAYFQNYTNTFMPLEQFRSYMNEAATVPDIVEIAVSTRPDCIREDYLDVLNIIRNTTGIQITIELGLQTVNYHTLKTISRGHSLAEFIDAVLRINQYSFDICTHVILNLPGDAKDDSIETAKILSALPIQIVKAHSLYIAKNTQLCDAYENGTITICAKEDYLDRLCAFLEYLKPDIAVERLFSRIPEKDAVFCNWNTSWWKLRDDLFEKMNASNSFQGKKFNYLDGAALRVLEHKE